MFKRAQIFISHVTGHRNNHIAFQKTAEKIIKIAQLVCVDDQEELLITFDDGTVFSICDSADLYSETRSMKIDDDLSDLVGGHLVSIEVKNAPNIESKCGDTHEVQFLEIQTNKCSVTIASHVEHNGYYGGFNPKFYYYDDTNDLNTIRESMESDGVNVLLSSTMK